MHNQLKMKNPILILIALFVIVSFLPSTEGTSGSNPIDITSLVVKFDKTDAQFTVNYDIGTIPKLYIMLLGGKSIEPRIKDVFSNLDYTVIKMDQEKTILQVKNISRYEKNLNYYLHDSIKFGVTINDMIIYIPGDPHPAEYIGLNATPAKFYRQ
ncbi:MAG: hypothetical protein O8C61_00260 [Candidatus Methanoperedens sp.]|nr:hypothetical protein [Candidatus Methanoperedens sp.]